MNFQLFLFLTKITDSNGMSKQCVCYMDSIFRGTFGWKSSKFKRWNASQHLVPKMSNLNLKCEYHLFCSELGTVRAPVFGRHQFFGTSEHYITGWMNYDTACCWFPTSSNILILQSQFWQIRFESCWLYCPKCRILVLLRYLYGVNYPHTIWSECNSHSPHLDYTSWALHFSGLIWKSTV